MEQTLRGISETQTSMMTDLLNQIRDNLDPVALKEVAHG